MLAATFTLTNCVKEVNQPVDVPSSGIPFEIVASASEDTKTENDGMKTKWTADDAINLFHAVTGSKEYVSDNSFTITEENLAQGRFKGELGEALDGSKSYDWYAFYPYSSYITTPENTAGGYSFIGHSGGLKQNAYDSMESLCGNVCPLYGIAENVPASELPSVKMNHLTSVVRIRVTNASGSPVAFTNASFTAPEDIVGQYYINFSTDQPAFTPKSAKNTATVEVTNATELANGEVADLYLAVKPFTAETGEEIVITVNGYSKTIKMTKNVTFTAGKIKTVNFSFTAKTATFDFTQPSLYGIEPSKEASKGVEIPESITVGDVTMTHVSNSGSKVIIFTKSDGATYEMRAYNTDVLSFAVPSGYVIKNMVFKGAKTGDSVFEPNSGVYESKVWTGSANPLDLNLIATANIETITVMYELGTPDAPKQKQTLSFPEESYTATIGSAFTSPVLSGANTVVTYSSSDENVATVDDQGKVTLIAAGKTTITATAAGDDNYMAASVSYTLVVNTAPSSVVVSFPWVEDFSGNDIDTKYSLVSGGSTTKVYNNENLAGGTAPEILISKGNGSLTANIDLNGTSGNLTLSFKSNNPGNFSVTSETADVIISDPVTDKTAKTFVCEITVPSGAAVLNLSITNAKSSNARVDDISLVAGSLLEQSLSFEVAEYEFDLGDSFAGQTVSGAMTTVTYASNNEDVATVDPSTGKVTLGTTAGTAIITATAAAENGYMSASATYKITVKGTATTTGSGTEDDPYTVADAIALGEANATSDKVWVKGTIVGYYNNNKFVSGAEGAVATNIAIGMNDLIIPVQLPSGNVRTALNLSDNPGNLNKEVAVYGNITTYFSVVGGIKNVTDYNN